MRNLKQKSQINIPKWDGYTILAYNDSYFVLCLDDDKNYICDYKTIEHVPMKNINYIMNDDIISCDIVDIIKYNIKTKTMIIKNIKELIGSRVVYEIKVLDKYYIICSDIIFELDKDLQITNKYDIQISKGIYFHANDYLIYIGDREKILLIDKVKRTVYKYPCSFRWEMVFNNNKNIFLWDNKNLYVFGNKLKIKPNRKINDICHIYNSDGPTISFMSATNRYIIIRDTILMKIYNFNLQLIASITGNFHIAGKYAIELSYKDNTLLKIYEFQLDIKRRILQKIKNTQYWHILRMI